MPVASRWEAEVMEEFSWRWMVLPAGDFILTIKKVEHDRGSPVRAQWKGLARVFAYRLFRTSVKETRHES
jgi:hypothetical protein